MLFLRSKKVSRSGATEDRGCRVTGAACGVRRGQGQPHWAGETWVWAKTGGGEAATRAPRAGVLGSGVRSAKALQKGHSRARVPVWLVQGKRGQRRQRGPCKGSDSSKNVNELPQGSGIAFYFHFNLQYFNRNKNLALNTWATKNSPTDRFLTSV